MKVSLARVPWFTITFLCVMVLFYVFENTSRLCLPTDIKTTCLTSWINSGPTGLVAWLFLHPFVYSAAYLFGDMLGFAIVGVTIETVMRGLKYRYWLFLYAYLLTLGLQLYLYAWHSSAAGTSLIIFGLVPVVWRYYRLYPSQFQGRLTHLVPVGLGILVGVVTLSIFADLANDPLRSLNSLSTSFDGSTYLHLISILYGMIFAWGFMSVKGRRMLVKE